MATNSLNRGARGTDSPGSNEESYSTAAFEEESFFRAKAQQLSAPAASTSQGKAFSFLLSGNSKVTIVVRFEERGLRLSWSGEPLKNDRVLWFAIWDDDLPEPKKWFELGPVAATTSSMLIDAGHVGRLQESCWQIFAIDSRR